MPKVNHKRIRERYNPKPDAREKAFHLWAIESFPCACGCGLPAEVVHHVLSRHKLKRWRRDHEFVAPMTAGHHMNLHLGDARNLELVWGVIEAAERVRDMAYEEGVL